MPGLYDSYQLANSRAIPQYQGSTTPELTRVADTMEQRYDTGVQQADVLDQSVKNSTASSFDQPLLNQMKTEARQKLQGYAEKGNYEDMWRNVAMDARDFAQKYGKIAANQQAIQGYTSDLDKRVSEGKLDTGVANARKLQLADTYTGLKVDPQTGQFTNQFVGTATTPSIDIPKKINEWLSNSHAIERGWKAEKDVNGWYVTNGTERKSLPWDDVVDKHGRVIQQGLKKVIDSGMALDPEVKSYLAQEHELAPYYQGVTRKISPTQMQTIMDNPTYGPKIKEKMAKTNMDPVSALHSVIGDEHVNNQISAIYGMGRKGVIDESKGEYGEKMDELTLEKEKKKLAMKDKQLFSVPFSDVGPGVDIKSEIDFNDAHKNANSELEALGHKLGDLKNAPGNFAYDTGDKAGKVFHKEADGSVTDITADADNIRKQIASAKNKVDQLDLVKHAAAQSSGFDQANVSASAKDDAEKAAQRYRAQQLYQLHRDNAEEFGEPNHIPTKEELARIEEGAQKAKTDVLNSNNPRYKQYEQELIKRLQPQGEGNKMLVFNDDNMKKTLGDFAHASISGLGLKQGLVSLKVASGKNMGQDLDASDYDDIQGKIEPVGITNDAKTGETKIVMRAMQDIHGKKIKGENLLMSMKDVGGIDNYVKTHSSPEEYHNFVMDRALKSGLNNTAGQMQFPITNGTGANVGNIQISRRKTEAQGPGSFSVRIPTSSGWKSVPTDSYEGVIDIINKMQDIHN